MIRYETETPRLGLGVAAVAMTALTLALTVVAPAKLDSVRADATVLVARKHNGATPTEVAIVPARIDVIGVRGPNLASSQPHPIHAASRPQG